MRLFIDPAARRSAAEETGGVAQAAARNRKRRWRRLRPGRFGAVIAILALALAGGGSYAVAELTAGPPPPNYEGTYGLFVSGSYAGPIHAFKGCTTDLETRLSPEVGPDGEVEDRQIPRRQVPVACEIEVGLGMSLRFREEMNRAFRGEDARALDLAIGRARADGIVTSELRFKGYMSDVTLPALRGGPTSEPSWLRLELVSETGTVTKVPDPGTRLVAGVADEPIDASKPRLALTGVDAFGLELDPLSLERPDIPFGDPAEGAINYRPGEWRLASPQPLRVRESAPKTVNAVAGWFDQQLASGGARRPKTLTVGYQDVAARRLLTLSLTGIPTHFDPYERTDGKRVLRLAVEPDPASIEWR